MITFDICETLFALLPGHYVLGFTSCGRARVQPGTHKGEGLANQISMHSQFDGLHALQELRRERNKRYRDRAAHSLVYVFFFFCHSTCNQGQKREKGRTPAGALMSLPLLDAFHTCQSLCKVHWRQDQRKEEDPKDQHKQWNAILIEVWCDHAALLGDLSGHTGHTRADYIRQLMSLGFSFVESVKKYGTCPAVIQRKLQREAKRAVSLAKKAEAPPRRAKRKKAPSKAPPVQDEKQQEVDSDNDSDIGASERFWMPSSKQISHMPERTAATA